MILLLANSTTREQINQQLMRDAGLMRCEYISARNCKIEIYWISIHYAWFSWINLRELCLWKRYQTSAVAGSFQWMREGEAPQWISSRSSKFMINIWGIVHISLNVPEKGTTGPQLIPNDHQLVFIRDISFPSSSSEAINITILCVSESLRKFEQFPLAAFTVPLWNGPETYCYMYSMRKRKDL